MVKSQPLYHTYTQLGKPQLKQQRNKIPKKTNIFLKKANQLSDILCRGATVSSIQSNNNTLTRGASLRDTGDYDVPHPHPHTHHYMTTSTSVTPPSMSMIGSCPGSAGGSRHGSGSGSSPGGCMSGGSIIGISGGMNYMECMHYERMPMPIPLPIPIVPPPPQMQSDDDIEPAYATGKFFSSFFFCCKCVCNFNHILSL